MPKQDTERWRGLSALTLWVLPGVKHLVLQVCKLKHRSMSSGIWIFRKCRHNWLQPVGSMNLETQS